MKRLSFLLFLVCLLKVSIASPTNELDSLNQVVKKQEGIEKMTTLTHIGNIVPVREKINVAKELQAEAEDQSDHFFLAWAYQYTAVYYAIELQKYDSTMYYAKKGLDELEKVDIAKIKNEGDEQSYNMLITKLNQYVMTCYTYEAKYYLAINHMQRLLEKNKKDKNVAIESDIYLLIGSTHALMQQPKEALEYLKEGLRLTTSSNYIKFIWPLQESYIRLKQYDEVIALSDSVENQIAKGNSQLNYDKYFLMSLYHASAYASIEMGDLARAREYIDKLAAIEDVNQAQLLHYIQSEYCYKTKNYNKALEHINMSMDTNPNTSVLNNLSYNETKAKILRALDRGNEAYDYLSQISETKDSLNVQRITSQMQEFETIYRTDKLKDELALSNEKLKIFRLHVAGFITITFLMLVLIVIIARGNRKLRKKNVELYKKHQEIDKVSLEMENLKISQLVSESNSNSDLALKLDNYMKESEAFLNPDITRDILALEMGTNRQYLIDAIREYKEQTFNEYVYSWRLKYTYNLIILNKDIPIAEIFLKSGFASRRVFNREFKKEFGMTPSELRVAADENND